MNNLEIDKLKSSLNIVDVVGKYFSLKKAGKDYVACCPFHTEKTPSFAVSESKQFYHCFGCGAQGDVIGFVMEYTGCDFMTAYKELGGELELMPSEKVKANIEASKRIIGEKVPPDHKQDEQVATLCLQKMTKINCKSNKYIHDRGIAYPIYTANRQLVNAVIFPHGQESKFIAGGMSYNGFTPIKVNDTNNFVACSSMTVGRMLACDYGLNVAVCWHYYVMKYICMWNFGNLNIKPVITAYDDDYLCHEMNYIYANYDNKKLQLEDRVREF